MSQSNETEKAFTPADSIQYADNSVVSKTIIKKPSGNITLFAFDKGEGLAEHSSPHEVLIQTIDGEAEITIGGNLNILQAGQSVILPANIPHSLHAKQKFKMMLTMIKS